MNFHKSTMLAACSVSFFCAVQCMGTLEQALITDDCLGTLLQKVHASSPNILVNMVKEHAQNQNTTLTPINLRSLLQLQQNVIDQLFLKTKDDYIEIDNMATPQKQEYCSIQ